MSAFIVDNIGIFVYDIEIEYIKSKMMSQWIPSYITEINDVSQLNDEDKTLLADVVRQHAFRVSDYYLNLINWTDPHDPIRRIVFPEKTELLEWGNLDASYEDYYTVLPGLEHKYRDTTLLLITDMCAGFCRYCFRKRLFMPENGGAKIDVPKCVRYITEHKEVNNVILSGGDPLILSTKKLEQIIKNLIGINHVRIIRIGTKFPAYNPGRILNDSSLLDLFESVQKAGKQLYLMVHFDHPREITASATGSIRMVRNTGTLVLNQSPIIRGINDDTIILRELFEVLSFSGVIPYYIFQCRPTKGNKNYSLPVEDAYQIFTSARMKGSGLSTSARFVMSHFSGKVEVVGLDNNYIYFKYLRAANLEDVGKFMIYKRNRKAYWLDSYISQNEPSFEQLTVS